MNPGSEKSANKIPAKLQALLRLCNNLTMNNPDLTLTNSFTHLNSSCFNKHCKCSNVWMDVQAIDLGNLTGSSDSPVIYAEALVAYLQQMSR